MRKDLENRFWRMVDKSGECWLWTGFKKDGYGIATVKGRPVFAHRHAYRLSRGPIPDEAMLLHSCDVRACVRPEHLRPGNHLENARDAQMRGRVATGPRLPQTRLTDDDVKLIRGSDLRTSYLARLFKMDTASIFAARQGLTFKWLPGGKAVPRDQRVWPIEAARRSGGLRHPNLSPEDIHLIRTSEMPNRYFAKLFKVHPATVQWVRKDRERVQ